MIDAIESEFIQAINDNDIVYFLQKLDSINIDTRLHSEDNDTLALYSISNPDSVVYKVFINNGANLELLNDLEENILHCAIYSKKLERVMEVIEFAQINKKSKEGITPLLLSIGLGNESIANLLIDRGADIEIADNEGNKPIHLASYFGLTSVVENLILNRVDIFTKTGKGNFALALAVNQGHIDIIKILYTKMYQTGRSFS